MGDSFERVTLTWENIKVFAPSSEEQDDKGPKHSSQKQILRDVSGCVEPGTLLAIMGASGAGKTTLMNVLNGRHQDNLRIEGNIKINGRSPGKGLAGFSAYVQQDDLFIGTLTVREHLWVQAMLRMDSHLSHEEKTKRIEELITDMSLTSCADTLIGIPGIVDGISGGERKRLAFASEVLTNPALFCCDEPTSGVDSFMAQSVVSTLRKMAAQGRTILCTIHQPSSEVFAMFDRVLIMAEGRTAFLGSTDDALNFFSSCGYNCPSNFNPADHFIHTLAVVPGREDDCKQVVKYIADTYDKSDHCEEVTQTIEEANTSLVFSDMPSSRLQDASPYKATWWDQFYAIFWRCMKSQLREPQVIWSRLLPALGLSAIISLLFVDQPMNQEGVANINGAIFLIQTQMTFGMVGSVVTTFPKEFPIFIKEHYDGMYRVDVYFLTKTLSEIPQFLILPLCFAIPIYWSVGLKAEFGAFVIASLAAVFVANVAVSFGYFLSSTSTRLSVILAVNMVMLIPIMVIGGFYLDIDSIPVYLVWLRYISWYTYANEILIVNQWKDVTNITCLPEDLTCFTTGDQIIDDLSYETGRMPFNFCMLLVLVVAYRVLAFAFLYGRSYRRHIGPKNNEEPAVKRRRQSSIMVQAKRQLSSPDESKDPSHVYQNSAMCGL